MVGSSIFAILVEERFVGSSIFFEVDCLLIDTQPGTSDEHILLVQFLLQAGPRWGSYCQYTSGSSSLDVPKDVNFCHKTKVLNAGVVENIAKFVWPHCTHTSVLFPTTTGGATTVCEDYKLDILTRHPLELVLLRLWIMDSTFSNGI